MYFGKKLPWRQLKRWNQTIFTPGIIERPGWEKALQRTEELRI